ncbi:MAG TPA: hypothetical protein VHL53_23265, partial [Acidimicrobiia bacterium]|nr:hypothetical protein [Acidimicrobiia bacterium]
MVGRSTVQAKQRAVALGAVLALALGAAACGGSKTTADFERAAGLTGESALAVNGPAAAPGD